MSSIFNANLLLKTRVDTKSPSGKQLIMSNNVLENLDQAKKEWVTEKKC